MNKLISIAALSIAAAAGSVFADDITIDNTVFVATKTRAEVRTELKQARADGSLAALTEDFVPVRTAASGLTRQEVRAEMRVNRDAGFAAAMTGEDSGAFYLSQAGRADAPGTWMARLSRAGH